MKESLHDVINELGFQMMIAEQLSRIVELLEAMAQAQGIIIPEPDGSETGG